METKLNEYFYKTLRNKKDCSEDTGIPIDAIYRACRGGKVDSLERAKKISEWTKGEIKIEDLMR